jgi:beta-lactamase regulating signal transducer with metallopeptidase domain
MFPALVAEALAKGAGLLLATALLARVLRRASAAQRHLVWAAGLGATLVATAAAALPRWRLELAAPWALATEMAPGGAGDARATIPWTLLAVGAWALGATALLAQVALDLWAARRLVRRSWAAVGRLRALLDELAPGMPLGTSAEVTGPVSAGLWRATILVPAKAGEWPESDQRVMLAHELAHIRRHDCLTQTLARVVCALHWVNPLAWWAERELRREREMAADDAALDAGAASAYARFLLSLAAGLPSQLPRAQAAMISMASTALGRRLERLLSGTVSRRAITRRAAGVAATMVLALALPLGCLGEGGGRSPLWVAMVDARATGDRHHILLDDDQPLVVDLGTRLDLVGARASLGRDYAGRAVVNLTFPPETAARLQALTGAHIGERMALVQGERVLMAPTVRSQISDRAKIDFSTKADAEKATQELLAALPAP